MTIAFWLHLPTQRYIGCHGFTKSLQTQMTQTHIPSFTDFFLMKTQEWKDCYAYRNIGIRGSNAKYETGMKELRSFREHILSGTSSLFLSVYLCQFFQIFLENLSPLKKLFFSPIAPICNHVFFFVCVFVFYAVNFQNMWIQRMCKCLGPKEFQSIYTSKHTYQNTWRTKHRLEFYWHFPHLHTLVMRITYKMIYSKVDESSGCMNSFAHWSVSED